MVVVFENKKKKKVRYVVSKYVAFYGFNCNSKDYRKYDFT